MTSGMSLQKKFDGVLRRLTDGGGGGDIPSVLLAVSGGRDSICMAELFLHTSVKVHFAVAHCNFHLRGEESDSDEALVRAWTERNAVRFYRMDFDTLAYASEHSISVEMAARELRYDWFASLCLSDGYSATAVAHNSNDNAETLFLNLLRGTGLRGLAGMQAVSEIRVTRPELAGVRLIRPMLTFPRAWIDSYVHEKGAEYHDDRTNAETLYKRNAIRHKVLPELERLNPSLLETIANEMGIFSLENRIIDAYFSEARKTMELEPAEDENLRIDIKVLRGCPHMEYMLYRFLSPYGFSGRVIGPVVRIVWGESGTLSGKTFSNGHHRILTTSDILTVKALQKNDEDFRVMVRNTGQVVLAGKVMNISLASVSGKDAVALAKSLYSQSVAAADASAVAFPFVLRTWKPGDWMRPSGMTGRKKLSDMFIDMKLNIDEKDRAVVAVSSAWSSQTDEAHERVAMVFGYISGKFFCRVDKDVKCSASTSSILSISI